MKDFAIIVFGMMVRKNKSSKINNGIDPSAEYPTIRFKGDIFWKAAMNKNIIRNTTSSMRIKTARLNKK